LLNPVAPPIIPSTHPAIPSTTAAAPTVPTNQPLTNERKVVRWFLLALGLAIIATCLYFASRSKTTECDSNPVDTITTNTCQNNGIYQVAKMGNISGSNVFNGPVNCNFAFPAVGVTITNIWVSPEAQSSPSQPQSKVLTQQNQTFNQGQVQIIETYGPPVFVGGNWCVSLGFGRGWIRCDDPRSGYQFGGHGWEHRYGWLESWQQRFDFHQNDRREFRFSK